MRNTAAKSPIAVNVESACAASSITDEVESITAADQFVDDADEHATASMLPVSADPCRAPVSGRGALRAFGRGRAGVHPGGSVAAGRVVAGVARTGGDRLLQVFTDTYGRLRNGFYGLQPVVLTLLFLALLRDPRAEGLTRLTPADLGRLLGLDRAPEVKTLRRKLGELAAYRRGAALQGALAAAHAAARPDAIGYLMIDGHMRAYFGTRDLQKTHVARLHMAARATAETWVADADGQPVMVITAAPSSSLAGEIERLLPALRATVGAQRRATLIFDRGGWSPALLKKIIDADFDVICWRKGDFEPLSDTDFTECSSPTPTPGSNTPTPSAKSPPSSTAAKTPRCRCVRSINAAVTVPSIRWSPPSVTCPPPKSFGASVAVGATRTIFVTGERISRSTRSMTTPTNLTTPPGWCPTPPRPAPPPR